MKIKTALIFGLPLLTAGALVGATPAQAATFGDGQLDLSNLPFGNAIYTQNAIDFTQANDANGEPIADPGTPGFVNVSATGDLAALSGQAQIFDLFSPVSITPNTEFSFPGGVKLLEFADGTEYFFTAFTRTGSNTGVQNFSFDGFFLNAGDRSFSTFAFVTGQAPVPITSTTLLASLDQIDDPGSVTGFTSYSGTILTEEVVQEVPEPASVLGLVAVSALSAAALKRKQSGQKA